MAWRSHRYWLSQVQMFLSSQMTRRGSLRRERGWRFVWQLSKSVKGLKKNIKDARQSQGRVFAQYDFDLTTPDGAREALQAVMGGHDGRIPDATFLCAGGSAPKFFVEMTKEELVRGLEMSYWIQAWSAWVRLSARPNPIITHFTALG